MNDGKPEAGGYIAKRKVVIVAMNGNMLLNFAGPADVFNYADKCQPDSTGGYDVVIASPTARRKIKTISGLEIHCESCVMDITTPIDTLIIAGNDFAELNNPANSDFYKWLSNVAEQNIRRVA